MKKTVRKLLTFMMAFIMIITLLPVTAFLTAEDVSAADVSLTLNPFVTNITSKNGTASIAASVRENGNATNNYSITWKSSDTDTVTVDQNGTVKGLERGSALITAKLTRVNGNALDTPVTRTVKVNVEYDISEGHQPGTNSHEYPEEGAVRINKTASSDLMDSDGLSEVELDVAGVGLRPGVDVVLVVDVSNSMQWDIHKSSATQEADRRADSVEETKLHDAMVSAEDFSEILLSDNSTNGSQYDNTISFVTFAGYDREHSNSNSARGRQDQSSYVDSVMTVFTAETSFARTQRSFQNTTLTYTDDYTLKVTNNYGQTLVNGHNRGNTNYDFAFWQANEAVTALRAAYENRWGITYADSERKTYVVFMTDGAPSHYDRITVATNNQDRDLIPEGNAGYTGGYTSRDAWQNYFLNTRNRYATSLYDRIDGNFYAIGFDLANGGFTGMSWSDSPGTLENLLRTMVDGASVEVNATADPDELNEFYRKLAEMIKPAGTEAQVIDTVNTKDFTVQTGGSVPFDVNGENSTHYFPSGIPNMQVKTYDLYTAADGDETLIGKRKGTYEVLETVTFNPAGTEAYSDLIDGGATNIMTISGNSITINAANFTYTKDPSTLDENGNPTETFTWNIGDIPNKEIAFSFYVYLKGSMEGTRNDSGAKYTNVEATLDYIDMEGYFVEDVFPQPIAVWKDAATEIEFYLVDKEGYPVNHAGDRIPFSVRVKVGQSRNYTFPVNHTENEQNSAVINAADWMPEGYKLYDPNAHYEVRAVSSEELGSFLHISEPSTAASLDGQSGAQTTIDVMDAEGTYTELNDALKLSTHVAFGLRYDLVPELQLLRDIAVIDYAKPIDIDIMANDAARIPSEFTVSFVGFNAYETNSDMTERHSLEDVTPAGNITAENGVFSLKTSGSSKNAHFELNKFMDTVNKTFGTVKFENKNNENDKFYMYNEIDVMPANNIYYEDDFMAANNTDAAVGFVYTGSWSSDGTVSGNTETPNNAVHGGWISGDPGLSGDDGYSDGSAHKTSAVGAKVTFNFTGTGVDVYTRTNVGVGKVRAKLYKVADGKETLTSTMYMDNYSKSGDYYQIPTLSYNSLDYGTYKLEITAGSVKLTGGGTRQIYYIDGIRVYNPIQNMESDSIVAGAYGEAELGASFTIARDLLEAGHAAFIDQIYKLYYQPSGGTKTYVNDGIRDIELATGGTYDEELGTFIDAHGDPVKDTSGRTISVSQKETGEVECTVSNSAITLVVPSECEVGTEAGSYTTGDYENTELGKAAPINEVYLAADQGVVIQTASSAKAYYVGLKALSGTPTVELTDGTGKREVVLNHTTDLYYRVTPDADGEIMVANSRGGLISITKVRIAGAAAAAEPTNSVTPVNMDTAPVKYSMFRALPVTVDDADPAGEGVTEEEITEENTTDLGETDIVIENPEGFEEESNDGSGSKPVISGLKNHSKASEEDIIKRLVSLIFGGIKSLFGR